MGRKQLSTVRAQTRLVRQLPSPEQRHHGPLQTSMLQGLCRTAKTGWCLKPGCLLADQFYHCLHTVVITQQHPGDFCSENSSVFNKFSYVLNTMLFMHLC